MQEDKTFPPAISRVSIGNVGSLCGSPRGGIRRYLFRDIFRVVVGSLIVLGGLLGMLFSWQNPFEMEPRSLLLLFPVAILVVSLGSYPLARRLTARLERLERAIEAWGKGSLMERVPVEGHDEIARLADSFNQAAERIESLVGAHRRLLANASHELRSPLARLRMAIELIGGDPKLSGYTGEMASLRHDIGELDDLIEEILLASRLDNPDLPLPGELVDLAALVVEECARCGVEFEVEQVTVTGDARLLRRLIRNLLENGLRHGAEPILARVGRTEFGALRLVVEDHGKGIPEAERERIFDPFYRPSGMGEGSGGWGLGLALVRQIALRHGATITCESCEKGGTCFVVLWPAAAVEIHD